MPIGLRERRIAIAFIGFCTALPVAAAAQDAPESAIVSPDPSSSDPDLRPAIADDGQTPAPTAEDNAIIDKALAVDPASYLNMPARPLRLPALAAGKGLDLSRTDRPDGSGTVVVKKPLASEWDANVGADLGYAADTPYGYDPRNPLRATRNAGGAAWASVGLPNFASIDARVDPNNEQGAAGRRQILRQRAEPLFSDRILGSTATDSLRYSAAHRAAKRPRRAGATGVGQ